MCRRRSAWYAWNATNSVYRVGPFDRDPFISVVSARCLYLFGTLCDRILSSRCLLSWIVALQKHLGQLSLSSLHNWFWNVVNLLEAQGWVCFGRSFHHIKAFMLLLPKEQRGLHFEGPKFKRLKEHCMIWLVTVQCRGESLFSLGMLRHIYVRDDSLI